MWSRRQFIFRSFYSALGASAFWSNSGSALSFAKHVKRSLTEQKPDLIAAEYWSPAIACDFIGVFDGDLCCILDEFGRFATVNILPNAQQAHNLPILGQLNNLGTKVLDFKIMEPKLAVVLAWNHSSSTPEHTDGQFSLILINLALPQSPQVVSVIRLADYTELRSLAVNHSLICVGGLDSNKENRVSIHRFKRGAKLQSLSSFTVNYPIKTLLLGEQELLVIHDGTKDGLKTRTTVVDVSNAHRPTLLQPADIIGDNVQISCFGSSFVMSRKLVSKYVVEMGLLRTFPQARTKLEMDNLQHIEALAMDKTRLLLLGERNNESIVIPFLIDKGDNLHRLNPINLKRHIKDDDKANKILLGRNNAFISANWEGVQVLSMDQAGSWAATTYYGVPKLPVAGLATWSKYLLLAGLDLRLYDLSKPEHPKLTSLVKLPTALKSMVSAENYILCLDRSGVTKRQIENPESIVASLKIAGEQLFFDPVTKKAYLIHSGYKEDKKGIKSQFSKLIELDWQSNNISTGKTFAVANGSYCCSANAGYVGLANLDSISIYKAVEKDTENDSDSDSDKENGKIGHNEELICTKQFEDLAWRQILLTDKNIFATAIDHNAHGIFLIMSFDEKAINLLGSIKIPHDGIALAINRDKNIALCVGQDPDGHSLLTTININNLSTPTITSSKSVLESASAVAAFNNLGFICGRGFEIFRL